MRQSHNRIRSKILKMTYFILTLCNFIGSLLDGYILEQPTLGETMYARQTLTGGYLKLFSTKSTQAHIAKSAPALSPMIIYKRERLAIYFFKVIQFKTRFSRPVFVQINPPVFCVFQQFKNRKRAIISTCWIRIFRHFSIIGTQYLNIQQFGQSD